MTGLEAAVFLVELQRFVGSRTVYAYDYVSSADFHLFNQGHPALPPELRHSLWSWCRAQRESILATTPPLNAWAGVEVRCVVWTFNPDGSIHVSVEMVASSPTTLFRVATPR